MKIEEALEMAENAIAFWKKWCEMMDNDMEYANKLVEAARTLREGEQPFEVVDGISAYRCSNCGYISATYTNRASCPECGLFTTVVFIKATKTYTTHRRITIETVESVPVFEEIEDE